MIESLKIGIIGDFDYSRHSQKNSSEPGAAHPLILSFVKAAMEFKNRPRS